jgi:hypothetical protein
MEALLHEEDKDLNVLNKDLSTLSVTRQVLICFVPYGEIDIKIFPMAKSLNAEKG